jgi:hypothetical protein
MAAAIFQISRKLLKFYCSKFPISVILVKRKKTHSAGIAQLVEQWTENPRVTSSNLVPGMLEKRVR